MLLWRLEGSCETGDIVLLHADLIESVCCRLLSTDTIKDESLWEAESALAQLWEHEDRVGANLFKNHLWNVFCSRITKRGQCADLDPEGLKIFLSNSMQSRRR